MWNKAPPRRPSKAALAVEGALVGVAAPLRQPQLLLRVHHKPILGAPANTTTHEVSFRVRCFFVCVFHVRQGEGQGKSQAAGRASALGTHLRRLPSSAPKMSSLLPLTRGGGSRACALSWRPVLSSVRGAAAAAASSRFRAPPFSRPNSPSSSAASVLPWSAGGGLFVAGSCFSSACC